MFDDKRQSWEILDVPNKIEKLKKLKKTVIVATTAIALLGSVFHFREEYRLLPNDQLNVTLLKSETQKSEKPKFFEAYSAFVFLTAASGTWTVPANWNNVNNRVDVIAGGVNGADGGYVPTGFGGTYPVGGRGGGAGGYAYYLNAALTPGQNISYTVGAAGASTGGSTSLGGFCVATGANGVNGGSPSAGTGGFKGGNGAVGTQKSGTSGGNGGGGGGAGGPAGAGGNGATTGVGGNGSGGATNGANGTNLANGSVGSGAGGNASTHIAGGLYGAGGAGGWSDYSDVGPGGAGKQGIIAISYVPRVNTTTTLSSNLNPSTYGSSVTLTATVTSGATGTCTFFVDGVSIGSATIAGTTAVISTSNLSTAAHSVYAVYNGDSNYFGSTSSTITQTVNKAATSISLVSSSNPSTFGNSITLTATVTNGATGSVTFYDNGVSIGTASISGNTATLTTNALSTGSHPLTATYNGDVNYNTSSSNTVTQVVNKINTSLSLTSSPNPQQFGPSFNIDLTVTISPVGGDGYIIYKINGVQAANIALISSANTIVWSPNTTLFNIGNNSVVAQYSGNLNYNGSISNTATESISFSGRPFNIFING